MPDIKRGTIVINIKINDNPETRLMAEVLDDGTLSFLVGRTAADFVAISAAEAHALATMKLAGQA
jgi:hypothetical protein